ncbi:SH3 domain-containing protein [Gaeumannomyces tritici R3-111a-1]|uniref:SH3 domain-containing protein n=1 Tax=Gaeumannomyces tritici (strain R3-111a-1) TaxID=644352 RepID=J3P4B5_GAET3|nr:SH3 domain-containing protein [Gaeumannomyces tritici R3-111a-1]EJT74511.1 SH3 domain-containing protein [Gaeumannomyces tritici R3-111a-1]
MTAVMSQSGSSPATSPPVVASPSATSPTQNPNHPSLHPLITSPPAAPTPSRRSTLPRPMSYASRNRLSQYSAGSIPSRSRPPSHIFPIYPSSLPYALVRDFAYPSGHPMHYGPPPEPSRPPSGMTTPASEYNRRLSDPPVPWESKLNWDGGSWTEGFGKAGDLAPMLLGDGPPWSEDEDLQSPVVSSRHRKHKSSTGSMLKSGGGLGHRAKGSREESDGSSVLNPDNFDGQRGYYVGTGGDGGETYYVNQGDEANGPGGEYVTYPPDQPGDVDNAGGYQMGDQQPRQYAEHDAGYDSRSDGSSSPSSPAFGRTDESRYSRDYQFTITSPDEEMHGKAVALFDFARENENELPLVEGQIIWVSYRHGQGWLVAMDPKTQESGLVPEEYVRLLREIEGGMTSLTGQAAPEGNASPNDSGTPTQTEHQNAQSASLPQGQGPQDTLKAQPQGPSPSPAQGQAPGHSSTPSNASNGYHQPVVSTFSTSSKDLDPYPQHLLGTQAGQTPPQVVHYHGQRGGSQANTPTLLFHQDVGPMRRGSQDVQPRKQTDSLPILPGARLESPVSAETTVKERGKRESR